MSLVASTSSRQDSKRAKHKRYHQEVDNYKFENYKYPEDVRVKIDIARSILKSCAENFKFKLHGNFEDSLDEISRFTGINKELGFASAFYYNQYNRRLSYDFINYIEKPTNSYQNFRHVVIESFLSRSAKVPCVCEVMSKSWELLRLTPDMQYTYCADAVVMDMAIHGFVMECYPGSDRQFIIQDPKNVMDRIFYLEKIIQYRESGRCIVYVETKIENTFIIVSPAFQIEQRYVNVFNQKDVEEAVMTCLIPFLPPNSVVVLDKDLRTSATKLPNEYATKKDMEKWLKSIGIPYDNGSVKAELYKLVMKYKNFAKEVCYLEEVLIGHGHTVLWDPKRTNEYNFSSLLKLWHKELKHSELYRYNRRYDDTPFTEHFLDKVKNTPLNEWKTYHTLIDKEEKQCLSEDLMVAEVIDHIILAARHNWHAKPGLDLCDFKMPKSKDPEFLKSIIIKNVQ